MSDTHIGTRLKQARLNKSQMTGRNITQGDVADASGISREHVSMIERKKRDSMPEVAAARAAEYLGCNYWWLLTGNNETPRVITESSKVDAVERIPVPDPDKTDEYIEIAAEIRAISDQLINNAQNNLPVTRLVKSLATICNEFVTSIPTKPAN